MPPSSTSDSSISRAGALMSAYLFSVSRPDRYLWITLDSSVW